MSMYHRYSFPKQVELSRASPTITMEDVRREIQAVLLQMDYQRPHGYQGRERERGYNNPLFQEVSSDEDQFGRANGGRNWGGRFHEGRPYEDRGHEAWGRQRKAPTVVKKVRDGSDSRTMIRKEEELPKQNIFKTRCTVQDRVCKLIVDGRSCENVVSTIMVDKLNLTMEDHPHPFKLVGNKEDNEVMITKRCLISFSIGNFQDKAWCDVIPMDKCHLLLGRPWQDDRCVTYVGTSNTYSFTYQGKKWVLHPLVEENQDNEKPQCILNHSHFLKKLKEAKESGLLLLMKENEEFPDVDSKDTSSLEEEQAICMEKNIVGLLPTHNIPPSDDFQLYQTTPTAVFPCLQQPNVVQTPSRELAELPTSEQDCLNPVAVMIGARTAIQEQLNQPCADVSRDQIMVASIIGSMTLSSPMVTEFADIARYLATASMDEIMVVQASFQEGLLLSSAENIHPAAAQSIQEVRMLIQHLSQPWLVLDCFSMNWSWVCSCPEQFLVAIPGKTMEEIGCKKINNSSPECSEVYHQPDVHLSKERSIPLDVITWKPSINQLFQPLDKSYVNLVWEEFPFTKHEGDYSLGNVDKKAVYQPVRKCYVLTFDSGGKSVAIGPSMDVGRESLNLKVAMKKDLTDFFEEFKLENLQDDGRSAIGWAPNPKSVYDDKCQGVKFNSKEWWLVWRHTLFHKALLSMIHKAGNNINIDNPVAMGTRDFEKNDSRVNYEDDERVVLFEYRQIKDIRLIEKGVKVKSEEELLLIWRHTIGPKLSYPGSLMQEHPP